MLNNFTKYWLTITCAPDSIANIKSKGENHLDIIRNEDNSKFMLILSNDEMVISMGQNYDDIKKPKCISFSDASNEIALYFNLLVIQI